MSIADKMKAQLQRNQGISSADVEKFIVDQQADDESDDSADKHTSGDLVDAPSSVKPEVPESNDPVMDISTRELDKKNFFLGLLGAADSAGRINITPEDKHEFVDAVLSGARMKLRFSFFGGKLSFTVKNRSYAEARAAMTMALKDSGAAELNTLFVLRLRLMLMCMQIDEFNGVSYPDADTLGPLMPTYENGKVENPKWLDRMKFFSQLPEAVFESVWQCIYEFEQKYWTLVRHSRDQDFWRPE